MSWPDRIKSRSLVHSPVHIMDIMATCLDAAGTSYPKEYKDNPIIPMEGESLMPALSGNKWQRQEPICWEHEGNRAVRDGRFKLVNRYPGKWELYDMAEDRTELNDLSSKNRPVVKRLEKYYSQWARRCGVLPWPAGSGWYVEHKDMMKYPGI